MSIPYIIILSDSEDEDEPMPNANIPSDSHNESHNSNTVENNPSEEDDPSEEEVVLETPPPSPVHWTYNTSGPYTIRTPGKSVAGSRRRMNSPPKSTTPTDPYHADRVWNFLPQTLQEWRKEEKIPSITEVGESSTARQDFPFTQEPPHHTVPLLVTRTIRHEDWIDHIEDALLEMPGADMVDDMEYQISCLNTHVEAVRDATEDLRQRAMQGTASNAALEGRMGRRMDEIEDRLNRLDTLVDTMKDIAAFMLQGDHASKKK